MKMTGKLAIALGLVFLSLFANGRLAAHQYFPADNDRPVPPRLANIEAIIEQGFIAYDPNYRETRAYYTAQLEPLTAQVIALQRQAKNMTCSDQMLIEARWLLEHTTDWKRLDAQLAKLANSLSNTDQAFAAQQSPKDGAWGLCYEEWFLKLDATIDALNQLAVRGAAPRYSLTFLQRIDDVGSLTAYLNSLLISDIAETGIDQRDELGAVTGVLSQLIFKPRLRQFTEEMVRGFEITDAYIEAYESFLESSQDPTTGYWGAWYRSGSKVLKSADLSLTYHTISYRRGMVMRWPQIVDTTFSIKTYEYPYGWMHNGAYNHHNNYDVVKILRYGWLHVNDRQRKQARTELDAMIEWCINGPIANDNLFEIDPTFYSSRSNYVYYAVSFLDEIGYLSGSKPFWTDRTFPNGVDLCKTLRVKLESSGLGDPSIKAAEQKLSQSCPAD